MATVGDRLAIILDRTIQFDLADRYQSTSAVLEDLDALSRELEEVSPGVTKIQELDGDAQPRFSRKMLAIMLCLGLGSIGAVTILQSTQTDPNKAIIEARIDRYSLGRSLLFTN